MIFRRIALPARASLWAMLAFLTLFYGLFLVAERGNKEPGSVRTQAVEASPSMREEIREREERFRRTIESDPALYGGIGAMFFLIFALGLTLDMAILVRKATGRPVLDHEAADRSVPWSPLDALHVFVFLFFAEAVILSVEAAGARWAGWSFPSHDLLLMINSVMRNAAVMALIFWTVMRVHGLGPAALGLTTRGFWRNAGRGILAYFSILPPLLAVLLAISALVRLISYEPPPQQVVEMYLREQAGGSIVFFTLFVAVLGPIMEEIFFRGFAFAACRSRMGALRASVLVSAVFAALHASAVALVPIFLLGMFLCYLYHRTGSLVPGIAAHVAHNLLMVVCTLAFKALSV